MLMSRKLRRSSEFSIYAGGKARNLTVGAIALVIALGHLGIEARDTAAAPLFASAPGEAFDASAMADERVLEVAPLEPGERRFVEVSPGTVFKLIDPVFSPAVATYAVSGDDLVVTVDNGGVLVLVGFFAKADPPASLSVLGGPLASAGELLDRAASAPEESSEYVAETAEEYVEPAFGGGAEVASIVSVLGWLLSRVDLGASAQAAEIDDPPSIAAVPLLDQVLAQMRIANTGERLRLIREHEAELRPVTEMVRELEAVGRGAVVDVREVEVAVLDVELALEEAKLEHDLAIDHHMDQYGYRLTEVMFPQWPIEPPSRLEDMGQEVARTHYAEARRQLRHLRYSRASLPLVGEVLSLSDQLRDAYAQYFEVGQVDIRVVLGAQATHLAAALRQVDLRHDEKRAEAWLLAVMEELTDAVLIGPGGR